MPLIAFQTHVKVKCAVCHCDLIANWDSEYMTMGVTPCYDCMDNAKKNAYEDNLLEAMKIRYDPYSFPPTDAKP